MQNDQRGNLPSPMQDMADVMSGSDKEAVAAGVEASANKFPAPIRVVGQQWEGVPDRIWERTILIGVLEVPGVWVSVRG
jgi:hypothetical protein